MQAWGHYTLLTELPTFMKNILHFNIMDDAFVSAVPYLLYFIVSILFSPVADIIIGKTRILKQKNNVFDLFYFDVTV